MIAVEVDGASHHTQTRRIQDEKKTRFLQERGWTVYRFSNREAVQTTAECVKQINGCADGTNCPIDATITHVEPVAIPDFYVYDITVEDCHNFYANGILVHNCQDLSTAQRELVLKCRTPGGRMLFVGDPRQSIMMFCGADPRSYHEIHERLGTHEMPLSICYRCPADVVTMAQEIVPQITARPDAPKGTIDWRTEEDLPKQAQAGDLIMCRKNAPLLKHCFRLIRNGVHARIRGREVGKELANLIRTIGKMAGTWEQFAEAVEFYYHQQKTVLIAKDASDAQLEMLDDKCACVSECYAGLGHDCKDAEELALKIENIFSDYGTAVWFSSIHRAKGLEAERTWILEFDRLGQPMSKRASDDEIQQEQHLRYVALTRTLNTMFLVPAEAK